MSDKCPRCKECQYKHSVADLFSGELKYICEHPDQDHIKKYFEDRPLAWDKGTLGFGRVQYTTAPEWCPLKKEKKEKNEA